MDQAKGKGPYLSLHNGNHAVTVRLGEGSQRLDLIEERVLGRPQRSKMMSRDSERIRI
jgi:hypothetical protein